MQHTIIEVATCHIKPGMAADFEKAMDALGKIFSTAKGYCGFTLLKCEGQAATYQMLVEWRTLADHRDHFRASRAFDEMVELLGIYFDRPADIQYTHRIFDARA